MKKRLSLIFAFLFFVDVPLRTLSAAFDEQTGGARAPGMSDAYTAVADDADAIVYNPAGLIQLGEGQLSSQYGQLVRGLDDGSTLSSTYVGYAHPLARGFRSLGFAYHNFKADNLFNERTIILSYGHRLQIDPFDWGSIWSVGANVKQFHREYQPDRFTENALNDAGNGSNSSDPLFDAGYTKDAYSLDMGGLVQFGPRYQYTAGVSIINANRPDVSLAGDGDRVPYSTRAALAYRPRWGTLTVEGRRTVRLLGIADTDLFVGLERNIALANIGAFIFRGGYGSGSRGFRSMTMGLSYLFSRFRLDYAFDFPVQALAETQGSHRFGFAIKMGGASVSQLSKDYSDADLLAAFGYDSLSTHVLLTRFSIARNLAPEQKDNLMLLLMRKYPLDDPGLKDIRQDLKDLIRKAAIESMEWPKLKMALMKGVPDKDKEMTGNVIELLVKGDAKTALVRIALLPPEVQRNDRIIAIALMGIAEIAAQNYRRDDIDGAINMVRQMVEILPGDAMVERAYRELLARRTSIAEKSEPVRVSEEMPEAPRALVAPQPVGETKPAPKASEFEQTVRAFGTSLGYYLNRKASGASTEELISLLQQIKTTYGGGKLDMTLIDTELSDQMKKVAPTPEPSAEPVTVPTPEETPIPATVIQPVATPVKPAETKPSVIPPAPPVAVPVATPSATPVAKPVVKPVESHAEPLIKGVPASADWDLDRAWYYYDTVAARDISDHEKLEILQSMLRRFGERGAARINKELERIRRRLQ